MSLRKLSQYTKTDKSQGISSKALPSDRTCVTLFMQFLHPSDLSISSDSIFLFIYWNKLRSETTTASSNGLPTLKRIAPAELSLWIPLVEMQFLLGWRKRDGGQGRGSQASSLNGIKYICQRISFNWQRLHWAFCQRNCVYCGYDLFSHS